MAAKINGFSLAYTATGAVVLWSGIKGTTLSTTFRGLLSGQAPSADQEPVGTAAVPADLMSGTTAGGLLTGQAGNTGADSAAAAANQAIARLLAAPYGWSTGEQWDDLVSLWNQESGWSATAEGPGFSLSGAGAYGIPQADPWTKLPQAAQPPAAGGSASATAQISWGLSYIKDTYGSPAAAWAQETGSGFEGY